jgi:hypothetical protein
MSKRNLIITIFAVFLISLSIFSLFLWNFNSEFYCKFNVKRCCPDCDGSYPSPSEPNPKNPKKAETKSEMDKNYALPLNFHLEKYKDKVIKLENGKTETELANLLFRNEKVVNNQLLFDSGKWQIYFWSQNPELKPKIDNFKIHGITHEYTQNDNLENYKIMMKPITDEHVREEMKRNSNITPEQSTYFIPPVSQKIPEKSDKSFETYQKSAVQIVIKVADKFEILSYKHILAMTGFDTQSEMLDFVLIHHKLLGNKKFWFEDLNQKLDYSLYNHIPLLFLQDYSFDNQRKTGNVEGVQFEDNRNKIPSQDRLPNYELEETLNFGCTQKYQNNLKVMTNLEQKEIQYFSHPTNNSLAKIKLKLENGDLKLEIKNELNCDEMIMC